MTTALDRYHISTLERHACCTRDAGMGEDFDTVSKPSLPVSRDFNYAYMSLAFILISVFAFF